MSDDLTGVTEISAASRAEISGVAQSYLQQASMLMPTVTDYSAWAVKGAKSVSLPRSGGFTPASKSENVSASATKLSYSVDTITFDVHRYVQWVNEKIADKQSAINLLTDQVAKASMDLGKDIDDYIVAQLKLASTSAPDHNIVFTDTTTDVLAAADLLECRRLLQVQFLNPRNLYVGIGPEKEKEMLNIANFIQAERYGSSEPVQNGEIGKVFGMKVLVHTAFEDFLCVWDKSAVGFAFQQELSFAEESDLANLGRRYSLDYIAGFQVLSGGVRQVFCDSTN